MTFDFGIMGPFSDDPDPEAGYCSPERLRGLLELAPDVEAAGFEKAWVTERHFTPNALPAPLPYCAALGARTSTLQIGTGIALTPFYDPVRLAEECALLDLITEGRFDPGLALGWKPEEFEAFGVEQRLRVPYLEETIEVLRQAFGDGPISHEGRVYEYDGFEVYPKPTRDAVPIWIGGTADPAVKRAARIGDGFYATPTALDELERKQALLDDVADTEDFPVAEWRYTHVSEGDAWEEAKAAIWHVWRGYMEIRTGEEQPVEMPAKHEEEIREECTIGTPAEVREAIHDRREAMGGNYRFVARMTLPGLPLEDTRRSIELFSDEVIGELA